MTLPEDVGCFLSRIDSRRSFSIDTENTEELSMPVQPGLWRLTEFGCSHHLMELFDLGQTSLLEAQFLI